MRVSENHASLDSERPSGIDVHVHVYVHVHVHVNFIGVYTYMYIHDMYTCTVVYTCICTCISCCHMCYMYLTSACVYMDGTETTFRTYMYMACVVRTDLCPPGPHRAAGEVCLSPGDGVRAGDSSGGDGETAQPVRMWWWCV